MNMPSHAANDAEHPPRVSGYGLATVAADGTPLDIWFPAPTLEPSTYSKGSAEVGLKAFGDALGQTVVLLIGRDPIRNVRRISMRVTAILDEPPCDIYDVYLRLHLLSHRLVKPRSINLSGYIGLLNHEVAWTSRGPCAVSELEGAHIRAQVSGQYLHVRSVFSLPTMLDHVTLADVRIADASRVLLGAHLAPGTVVTPEGFCGVNAGTLGTCMVEGRISAGVVVNGGSHIGGGASLMGSTSGGNRHMVTIGARCLVGANAGTAISLGDDCAVEAGCYVTGGLPVALQDGREVKAIDLAGRPGFTFRRNARNGRIEAVARSQSWGTLMEDLHRTHS